MSQKNNDFKPEEQIATARQFVEQFDSDTIVRNLAFWLDLAVNKGRFLDIDSAKKNVVSKPDNDS